MTVSTITIIGKKMRFLVRSYGGSEFRYLMRRDPLSGDLASGVKHDTYKGVVVDDNIFDGASLGKFKFDPRSCFDALGKLGASELDEKRRLMESENPGSCEDIHNYCRLIGEVDYAYFGNRSKEDPVVIDIDPYEDSLTAALLSAFGPIREVENAFKKIEYKTYDIHFDRVNREVIISKSIPNGLRGWILSKLDYGFGIEGWRRAIHIGRIRIRP